MSVPEYVEPTVQDWRIMKDGPPCLVCGRADRRPVIREYESHTGDIESVQGRQRVTCSGKTEVLYAGALRAAAAELRVRILGPTGTLVHT